MKTTVNKYVKYILGGFIVSCFGTSLAYAASCEQDVQQMYAQVAQYESITSHDGHRFTAVYSPSERVGFCYAEGYYSSSGYHASEYVCTMKWKKGDWGNTFGCAY